MQEEPGIFYYVWHNEYKNNDIIDYGPMNTLGTHKSIVID